MFAFHRPKIYRSINGCCICKAKSSSSRFTDSKKYENEFKLCFNLDDEQKRAGEICNACVLLIKRWKKLPKGTERNWNHVVDARAGPGGKSLLRSKLKHAPTKSPRSSHGCCNSRKRKHRSAEGIRKMRLMDRLSQHNREDAEKAPLSPTPSESSVDDLDDTRNGHGIEMVTGKQRYDLPPSLRAILDTTYWKMENICCGTIFKGGMGEVLIEPTLFKPCASCAVSGTIPTSPPRRRAAFKTADVNRDARPDSLGSDDSLDIWDRETDESAADDETTSTEGDVLDTLMGLSGVAAVDEGVVAEGVVVSGVVV